MDEMLNKYKHPEHKDQLFERMGVKEGRRVKEGYTKNQRSEVLNQYQQIRNHIENPNNPYQKKHHPTHVEYQATANVIGHTILVYTKNRRGHLEHANRFTPQGKPRGSPIVVEKSPRGTYSLDVQRTQHWSFYGAVASHTGTFTAEQLYDQVKTQTRKRLQTPPQVLAQRGRTIKTEPLQNELEYLEHHANAIPQAINTHELQTLADILKRPIRTNPIMSMGYGDRNTIHMTPTGWTGSKNTRDLVVLFNGTHYRTPKTSNPKAYQNMLPVKKDLSRQVETIIKMLPQVDLLNMENPVPPTTAHIHHVRRNNERVVPLFDPHQEVESLQEQAHDIQVDVQSIESPADARRAEVAIHDLTGKFIKYTNQHHPEDLPMVIEQAKASPGLLSKITKHMGSAVQATGRSAKGVVDRSSLGDLGVSGIAIVSGLSVLSSYTSVWRVFFG